MNAKTKKTTAQPVEKDWVEEIGSNAYAAIVEMVDALQCDYDRLDELRDDRSDYEPEIPDDFEVQPIDDADKAKSRATCGACGRSWDDGHVTGMTPTPGGRCPFEAWHDVKAAWAEANPDDAEELSELEKAAGECENSDDARQRIEEDALSVQVRSGWVSQGDEMQAEEFELLLSTGGPAVRIVGELNQHGEPNRARLEVQDWFKPWTEYVPAEQDVLLAYAQCFYFGQ